MAQEIKNTFLKSKMNKDLDDRILPNGEYRDARNISVGRSEDSDVGALENIIGNSLLATTDLGEGLTIIGIEEDNSTDRLFVFLTDYTDPNPLNPTNAPSSSKHYIYTYSTVTGSYIKLVEGEFLNFSTTNRIIGINLIENLLFWTDNRNQPKNKCKSCNFRFVVHWLYCGNSGILFSRASNICSKVQSLSSYQPVQQG